jgi:hypothetical protein
MELVGVEGTEMMESVIYAELLQRERQARYDSPAFAGKVSLAGLRSRLARRPRRESQPVAKREVGGPVVLPF